MKYYRYKGGTDGGIIAISKNIKRYISKTGGVISLMDSGLKECATKRDKQLLVSLVLKGFINVEKETLCADELKFRASDNNVTWKVRVVGEFEKPTRNEYWSNY